MKRLLSTRISNEKLLKNPHILIPSRGPPTPRIPSDMASKIEAELHRSADERCLPPRSVCMDIREHGLTPTLSKASAKKGKVKSNLKHLIREYGQQDTVEVEYIKPRKQPVPSVQILENGSVMLSGAAKRQMRMSETVKELISRIIHEQFASNDIVNSSTVNITSVNVSSDLSKCHINWLPIITKKQSKPSNNNDSSAAYLPLIQSQESQAVIEKYQNEFDRIKGRLRWKVTDKLSYLRQSPQLVFKYDDKQAKLYSVALSSSLAGGNWKSTD